MCNIAGYAGTRRAAPILIEMMHREQFIDGGLSTGIATIHEGKLYTAKVLGDVDELLRTTDALNFPGTVGIMHSRPTGNLASHAHPFVSESGETALVLNGTLRDVATPAFYEHSNAIMQDFLDRGFTIKTAYERKASSAPSRVLKNGLGYHDSEVYAQMIGEAVTTLGRAPTADDLVTATAEAIEELPADIVILALNAKLDGTITAGTVTRPMVAGFGNSETYLATTALAFPDDIQAHPILPLPPTSVSSVTKDGVFVRRTALRGVKVEQIDYRIASEIYARLEKLLSESKEHPASLYDMPVYEDWRDIWSKPEVDCVYAKEGGLLKPYATILYEALWSFHKQGRLHSILGERKGNPMMRFWIE
ncbi:MAG: hypothetical protein J6B77_02995 [Clostridia bacterium]|nr:hypothetical protein [Clostridia bacterium]